MTGLKFYKKKQTKPYLEIGKFDWGMKEFAILPEERIVGVAGRLDGNLLYDVQFLICKIII